MNSNHTMSEKEKTYGSNNAIPKENPFAVPDGYFENLPVTISERVKAVESKNIFSGFFFKPAFAFSSFGVMVIILLFYFFAFDHRSVEVTDMPDVTLSEVLNEYPDLLYSLDDNDFIDVVLSGSDDDLFFLSGADISDDEIIEYLSDDNDVDEDILYNKFYN